MRCVYDVCRVSDAGGSIEYSEVKTGDIRKSDLDSNVNHSIFIFDDYILVD